MSASERHVPVTVLLSDRVLDATLSFLHVRSIVPGEGSDVGHLARWDLKAALAEALYREGIDVA